MGGGESSQCSGVNARAREGIPQNLLRVVPKLCYNEQGSLKCSVFRNRDGKRISRSRRRVFGHLRPESVHSRHAVGLICHVNVFVRNGSH